MGGVIEPPVSRTHGFCPSPSGIGNSPGSFHTPIVSIFDLGLQAGYSRGRLSLWNQLRLDLLPGAFGLS